ncbi:MAG: hypothetical protein O3A46_15470 [Candidatus Poribacteria bacterium]|nr:hypothetical protein [Candidatus Poribacteria bacterium]
MGFYSTRNATIHAVEPYNLHGVLWYAITLVYDDEPGKAHQTRLAHDAVYDNPVEGDAARVTAMMTTVLRIERPE